MYHENETQSSHGNLEKGPTDAVPTENSYSLRGNELQDSLVLEELLCEALIC